MWTATADEILAMVCGAETNINNSSRI